MAEPAIDTDPDLAWQASVFDMLWSNGDLPEGFAHPGWSVYRNTSQWGCLSALRANFAALAMLTGEEAFGVLARAYLQRHPPHDARLLHYGAELPDFLSDFEPAQPWPHLVDIARLDRLWIEAHVATDADALAADDVLQEGGFDPSQVFHPHPGTRWLWSDDHPIATLWLDAREGRCQREDLLWQGEGVLITRPQGQVQACPLSRAGAAFLAACAAGKPLMAAFEDALSVQPDLDLSLWVAQMLTQGALCRATL